MKRNKTLFGAIAMLCMLSLFAACGGRADAKYAGKYVAISSEMLGVTLQMNELQDYGLELKEGGKGSLNFGGTSYDLLWSNDDEKLTIQYEGVKSEGTIDGDTIAFHDLFGMEMKLVFALAGSDAANPENNMPENDRAMLGTWKSTAVQDVLGDPVDTIAADALQLEFTADYKVNVVLSGQTIGTYSWSFLGEWGIIEDDEISLNWEFSDSGITVNYTINDEYYTFPCTKQ